MRIKSVSFLQRVELPFLDGAAGRKICTEGSKLIQSFLVASDHLRGDPPPPRCLVESWSYVLLVLQKIDSAGVKGKICLNKDLSFFKELLMRLALPAVGMIVAWDGSGRL